MRAKYLLRFTALLITLAAVTGCVYPYPDYASFRVGAPGYPPGPSVSVDVFGKLCGEGSWSFSSDYGWVWQPGPALSEEGWHPYSHGEWVYGGDGRHWSSYYGWGPYVYGSGNWAFINGSWSWIPGATWSFRYRLPAKPYHYDDPFYHKDPYRYHKPFYHKDPYRYEKPKDPRHPDKPPPPHDRYPGKDPRDRPPEKIHPGKDPGPPPKHVEPGKGHNKEPEKYDKSRDPYEKFRKRPDKETHPPGDSKER